VGEQDAIQSVTEPSQDLATQEDEDHEVFVGQSMIENAIPK